MLAELMDLGVAAAATGNAIGGVRLLDQLIFYGKYSMDACIMSYKDGHPKLRLGAGLFLHNAKVNMLIAESPLNKKITAASGRTLLSGRPKKRQRIAAAMLNNVNIAAYSAITHLIIFSEK
jgi:hypothetical protein